MILLSFILLSSLIYLRWLMALTDHGNMFGVLNFYHICRKNKINPIIGEEFYVAYGKHTEHTPVRLLLMP
ncbi:MAG: PHP domain-containing protein [Treponema sp.]|nr:PHP domain-containing protein [Treponema sp.]